VRSVREVVSVFRSETGRIRFAAAASFLAVAAFVPIPLGYLLAAPGRGSETIILANILAPAMLSIAIALGAQAFGFLAVLGKRMLARCAAAAGIAHALGVGVLGVILLVDRLPCQVGLYCSGQALGAAGGVAIWVWFLVLGNGYLVVGALLLGEKAVRRTVPFALATSLLFVDGLVFLLFFASLFYPLGPVASSLFYVGLALGPTANAVIGSAFLMKGREGQRVVHVA